MAPSRRGAPPARPRRAAGASAAAALLALLGRGADARQLLRGRLDAQGLDVRKPLADPRKYEYASFEQNGLRVLAVEDRRAAKAGFAVSVEAGSFYDPADFPGLAHFCEHLLFLGTEKYPDEASFDQFMSLHDGSNNAYTEQERTVFYNEVSHAGFDEGMDRFAQFFIAPMFKQEMVSRELNAVNSEHEKNIPDQGRRLWEILRKTARNDSVVSRFYTGTTESLHHGDADAVATLRRYHTANYCGPRMSLVMVSNLSTAEQLRIAHKHFDGVPRGNCGPTTDFGAEQAAHRRPPPFDADHLGQYVRMGTNSTPALWVMFPLPPTAGSYKHAPMAFLEYMLGYAGKGSLRAKLKQRGLINSLDLQVDETTAATLMFVMYDLTPAGAEDVGVKEVLGNTFEFLQRLNNMSDTEVASVYGSLQRMSQVNFDYSEAPGSVMDATSDLAAAMSRFPAQDVLSGSFGLVESQDPALVRALLGQLARGPSAASVALATPALADADPAANHFEKYYGIRYSQGPIPSHWVHEWSRPSKEAAEGLTPPPALKYVPTELSVRNISAGRYPVMLEVPGGSPSGASLGSLELWWKGQGAFVLPKAQLRMRLAVPQSQDNDVTHEVLRRLHAEVVRQVLEEPTEDFQNCGLSVQIDAAGDGYRLQADGYDEHLDVVLLQALDGLLDPNFGAAELARARRQVSDDLSDTTRKAPYELAMDAVGALTTDDVFTREAMLAELPKVDEQRLRSYLSSVRRDGLRAQLLSVGNLDEARAKDLAGRIARRVVGGGLASSPQGNVLAAAQVPASRLLGMGESRRARVLVASQPVEVRMRNPIPGDQNHATVAVYQYGVPDVAERVRLMLIGKMIANPVYDALRTKKQLGYIVDGFVTEHAGVLELRVLVQGAKEAPDLVEGDIDVVLAQFQAGLRNITALEFSKWKASLRSSLNHEDQNMAQEADRYWGQIASDGHCFTRRELALQYLESLRSVDDVVKTFDLLRAENRKITVKMFGAGVDDSPLSRAGQPADRARPAPVVLAAAEVAQRKLGGGGATYYPTETVCRISK